MTQNEISTFIANVQAGQFGVNLVVTTLQDSKLSAAYKDYKGRVVKVTLITNVRLGCKYESRVNLRTDDDFKSENLRGMVWLQYPYIKQAIKSGKHYLSICYSATDKQTEFKSVYLVDGKLTDTAKVEQMFRPSAIGSKPSKRQLAVGITEQEQIKVVQYCIDDIELLNTNKEAAISAYKALQ